MSETKSDYPLISALYKLLIEGNEGLIGKRNESYKDFIKNINLSEAEEKQDEEFLWELLGKRSNGIAGSGQSSLGKDKYFKYFIKNKEFIGLLNDFKNGTKITNEQYLDFRIKWRNLKNNTGDNPILANRVIATFTTDVSRTVDESKFDLVYNWFKDQKLITDDKFQEFLKIDPRCKYVEDVKGRNWYTKNLYLISELNNMLNKEKDDDKKLNVNQFVWELYDKFLSVPFNLKKQVVKYGPPGTGKTYQAKSQTRLHFNVWLNQYRNDKSLDYNAHTELVQFHPSFSYEDFIEGLRPTAEGKLALHDGVFKAFCKRAAQWEIDFYNLGTGQNWEEAKVTELKEYEA